MDKKIKTKWVKALRSNRYKQGHGKLYDGDVYCCLGVLCRVVGARAKLARSSFNFTWGGCVSSIELPYPLRLRLKIKPEQQEHLIRMNDGNMPNHRTRPFPEIADYIEKHL